jgi:hypothetical protein
MSKIRPENDHYPTPPAATWALLRCERFAGPVWEPCAGAGEMASVLRDSGLFVVASTIEERNPALCGVHGGIDFLSVDCDPNWPVFDNIITNPPFKIAEKIIRKALSHRPAKVAMLLNIKFLSRVGRARNFFHFHPPSRVWVIGDRITMYPADYDGPRGTTTETHAWFVWDDSHIGAPQIGWVVAGDHKDVAA